MTISDSQYKLCCDQLHVMFASLIIDSIRENREYVIKVNSALIGERVFAPFKPLFQSVSYIDEVTSVQFTFNQVPEDSPLLTIVELEAAYNNIPRKLARYITAEFTGASNYEREHLNECLEYAASQIPGVLVDDIKRMIQQAIAEYQSLFLNANTYEEKNTVLLKMSHLYNTTRNASKLSKYVQNKQQKSTTAKPKPAIATFSTPHRPSVTEMEKPIKSEPIIPQSHIKIKTASVSLSSLLGILTGFALLLWAIFSFSDSHQIFFNINSLLFVVGGTLACTMVSYHGLYIWRALKEILQIFIPTHVSPRLLLHDVETLLRWSQKVRTHQQEKRPFRQLEEQFSNYEDPDSAFTHTAIGYLLENYESERLMTILNNLVNTMFERSQILVRIIYTMGSIASIVGIIGTIISIIIALTNPYHQLNELISSIASSFIPTLYGLVLAYLVFKPAARKLEQKNEMRRFRNQLLSRGFILLLENRSALEIQDNLNSFLDPESHFHIVSKS